MNRINSWFINEENVLKHPKKPILKKNNVLLLVKFDATNIPKKNDAIKLIIEVFWISKPILILKLFWMNILSINPRVLPSKIIHIDVKSKLHSYPTFYDLIGIV